MNKQNLLIVVVLVLISAGAFAYVNKTTVAPSAGPTQSQTSPKATLTIGDVAYPINIVPGMTVMDAMNSLSSTGAITYTSQEYTGLGAFIDSINGQKSGGNNYWMLYVNGTTTATGVSATTITAGDVVEWRYEKSY